MNDVGTALGTLLQAIDTDGDLSSCEEIVASNFPAFIDNEVLNAFPPEMLFGILANESIQYPSPEITARFFVNLFERGEDAVKLFSEVIPYDSLSAKTCEVIAGKLESLGQVIEARTIRRIGNLYARIENGPQQRAKQIEQLNEKARNASEMLERMTGMLRQTSVALKQATEDLAKKDAELKGKDDIIARLTVHKPGRR
jgi:hypothetical protein